MKKALIGVLGAILLVAVGFYAVVVRPLISPAAQTFAAEAALATPELILLAAVNVRQAVFLERWYLGAPAVATGGARAARPVAERTMLEHLAAARVGMRRVVERGLYRLFPAADEAELAWWQPLAHSDVLSVGMWRPRDAPTTVTTPMLQASARAAVAQAADVEHLYLGLGAKTVPPSGRLRLVLDAGDAARL